MPDGEAHARKILFLYYTKDYIIPKREKNYQNVCLEIHDGT